MRIIKFILLGLIITINASAQTSRRTIELTGSISEEYPIKMTLTLNGDDVIGFYFYEKYKTKILLEGKIDGDRITVSESSDYDPEPEFKIGFVGELVNGIYSGVWTDKDGDLNFELSVDSDNKVTIAKSIAAVEGMYENVRSSNKFISSVSFSYITNDLFCFEISTSTELGCVGYLKGLVKLVDLKKGNYTSDTCGKVSFIFSSSELMVSESNCDMHGMECSFGGKFKKK